MVYLLGVAFVATRYGRGPSLAGRGAERRRVRLLLRAAVPHLRGVRHPVPVTFARHARRGPPRSARWPRGCARRPRPAAARAAHAPLRDEPRPGRPRDAEEIAAVGARHVAELLRLPWRSCSFRRPAAGLVPLSETGAGLHPGPARGRRGPLGLRPRAGWREPDRHAARPARCTCRWSTGSETLGVLGVRPATGSGPGAGPARPARGARAPDGAVRSSARGSPRRPTRPGRRRDERLRSTLLSSVSHDLRTPLAAITGAASTFSTTPTACPSCGASSPRPCSRRRSGSTGSSETCST